MTGSVAQQEALLRENFLTELSARIKADPSAIAYVLIAELCADQGIEFAEYVPWCKLPEFRKQVLDLIRPLQANNQQVADVTGPITETPSSAQAMIGIMRSIQPKGKKLVPNVTLPIATTSLSVRDFLETTMGQSLHKR